MTDEELLADYYLQEPGLTNWEIEYDKQHLDELEAKRQQIMKDNPGDPMRVPEYVRLRLTQEVVEKILRRNNIVQYVKQTRDRNQKILAKAYGKQGDMIHSLRAEIALLRSKNGIGHYVDTIEQRDRKIAELEARITRQSRVIIALNKANRS